ncbi:MAG: ScyD/ScyE family protein [Acidobacteriia bacterium]|nr:ScyD/ScyE family protein [Terriglobia bacterium]
MLTKYLVALFLATSPVWCQPQVIATGLPGAHKIILTPGGNFLVSEPSTTPNAGRVSFVTRSGARRSLLEGLPSGIEVTLAGASGPSAMAIRGRTLYLAFGAGDAERRGTPPTSIHNPQGASSPIFASILEFRFNLDPDSIAGTFRLTLPHQQTLADGGEVELADGNGGTARISLLARFPVSEPAPNILYRFSNPWGLALTEDGRSLYVTDASVNSLSKVDTATGRWRRLARFPPVSNSTPVGPPVIDAVPTSLRLYGDQVLVSFLTGFPFVPGNARILAVNPDAGASEPFIFGLNSATDVLWRSLPDGGSQFFVLEFSTNQGATPPPPGRLLRFDAAGTRVVAAPLITPVSMVYDEATQELFILELRGQILRLRLD